MAKICFLFGHRNAPYELRPEIEKAVERHYREHGIQHFVVGQYGAFDGMAATAAKAVRERYEDMRLSLLIPYHPAIRPVETPKGFDGTLYPEGMESVPLKFTIVRANQYMVKRADSIICYVKHFGNTRELLEQARRLEQREELYIENLAENL